MKYAIVVGWTVIGLAGASCNAILGLDDVRLDTDGGTGQVGGHAGTGGTATNGGGGAGGPANGGAAGTGRGGAGGNTPTGTAGMGPAGAGGSGPAGAGGSGPAGAGGNGPAGVAGTGPAGAGGPGGTAPGGRGGTAGAGLGGRGGAAGSGPGGAAGTGLAGMAGGSGSGPGGRGGAAGSGPGGRGGTAGTGPGGGGGCARELTRNGDFEMARTFWSEAPTGTVLVRRSDDAAVQMHQITAQSGSYLLRLGAPSTNAYVVHYAEQYVDIPSNAAEVTISGYLQVRTEEPPDEIYDVAYVQLADASQPSTPFFRSDQLDWSNLTQANSWMRFSFPVNVSSITGRQMVFRILADLDTSKPTYFYFDTVSVAVTRCSP